MEKGDLAVVDTLKLLACMFILLIFHTVGGMDVQDDTIWLGLCVLLSAYMICQSEDRIYIEENEDE